MPATGALRAWRNGRRAGFRSPSPSGGGGSTPLARTVSGRGRARAFRAPPPTCCNGWMLTGRDLTIEIGGRPLLRDAAFMVGPDDKVGLVGRNGTGKSSLVSV